MAEGSFENRVFLGKEDAPPEEVKFTEKADIVHITKEERLRQIEKETEEMSKRKWIKL